MNTFYFDDKTEKIVTEKSNNSHTVIHTNKDLKSFIECFENCRFEGYSIVDCIDWAK